MQTAATNPGTSNTVPPVTLETVIAESFTDAITAAMNFLASKGCNESEDRVRKQSDPAKQPKIANLEDTKREDGKGKGGNSKKEKPEGNNHSNVEPDDYRVELSKKINCYSYAFGFSTGANPGDFSIPDYSPLYDKQDSSYRGQNRHTVGELADYVMRDMNANGRQVRIVTDPSQRNENEYIVAMKTSDQIHPDNGGYDYHFARQLSDGTWADKPGQTPSRWNEIDGTADTWDSGEHKDYYNSETIYFAVVIE